MKKTTALKDNILKELDLKNNTLNGSSLIEGFSAELVKNTKEGKETAIIESQNTNPLITNQETRVTPLKDLLSGICGQTPNPNYGITRLEQKVPIAVKEVKRQTAKTPQPNKTSSGTRPSSESINSILSSIEGTNKENRGQPSGLQTSSQLPSKAASKKDAEQFSNNHTEISNHGHPSGQNKRIILMPRNLQLTKEQVAFLGDVQNALDVVSQMKTKIESLQMQGNSADRHAASLSEELTKFKAELALRDEANLTLKAQLARCFEEKNHLASELAGFKNSVLDHRGRLESIEKECQSLRAKNKKLVVDNHVLQEIMKEMVFEKDQQLNGSSFHHRDAGHLSEVELLYAQPLTSDGYNQSPDMYHSFGEGVGAPCHP